MDVAETLDVPELNALAAVTERPILAVAGEDTRPSMRNGAQWGTTPAVLRAFVDSSQSCLQGGGYLQARPQVRFDLERQGCDLVWGAPPDIDATRRYHGINRTVNPRRPSKLPLFARLGCPSSYEISLLRDLSGILSFKPTGSTRRQPAWLREIRKRIQRE